MKKIFITVIIVLLYSFAYSQNQENGVDNFIGDWHCLTTNDTITITKNSYNYHLLQNGKTVSLNNKDGVLRNDDPSTGKAIFNSTNGHVFWQKKEYEMFIPIASPSENTNITHPEVVNESLSLGEFFFTNGDTYNYGTVSEGPAAECDFEFTNNGQSPIIISEAHGSCGCVHVDWPQGAIAPGTKNKIHVSYTTQGRPGPIMKEVTITSNATQQKTMLHIRGNVTP